MKVRQVALWTSMAGVFLVAWVVPDVAPGQQPRRVDDAALRNAGKTGEEWLSYGLTPGETRYSPLKQIDATNVSRLGLDWSYEIGPGGGNQEATPLMCERDALQHHQLEHRLRGGCAHRQGKVALGSGSEPCRRAAQDLLRRGESRHRDVRRQHHRSRDRRAAGRAEMPRPASRYGNRALPIRRTTTPSPWRRASPKAR